MSHIVNLAGGQQSVIDWIADHDLEPADILRTVEFADDGSVVLRQIQRDSEGEPIVVAAHTCQHCGCGSDPGDMEQATKPVIVAPKRPFPISP